MFESPTGVQWIRGSQRLALACCLWLAPCLVAPCTIATGQDDPAANPKPAPRQVVLLNGDRSAEGTLLAWRLRSQDRWPWWSRQATQDLLKSVAVSTRIDLPILEDRGVERPSTAPLLIAVTSLARDDQKFLRAVVCDCETGLRLGEHLLSLDAAALDIEGLAGQINESLARHHGYREVWAVPPLVSRDLGREHEATGRGYATEITSTLLARPGVLVVEFEFAAIIDAARRAAGQTSAIVRPTPSYVFGDFRHEGDGAARKGTIRLKLIHREMEELEREAAELTPEAATEFVRGFATDAVKRLSGAGLTTDRPDAEGVLLADRWDQLQRAGDWPGAWHVAEARLLLDPRLSLVRCQLLTALTRIAQNHRGLAEQWSQEATSGMPVVRVPSTRPPGLPAPRPPVTIVPAPQVRAPGTPAISAEQRRAQASAAIEQGVLALNTYRRGLAHMHLVLNGNEQAKTDLLGDRAGSRGFAAGLLAPSELRVDTDRRYAEVHAKVAGERRTVMARMFVEAARIGRLEQLSFLDGESSDEILNTTLRALVETQDLPNVESRSKLVADSAIARSGSSATAVDIERFVRQLAASGNPALAAAAADAQKRFAARQEALQKARAAALVPGNLPGTTPDAAANTDERPPEVEFEEIKLLGQLPGGLANYMGWSQLCLSAGKANLFCGRGKILMLKKKGVVTVLWEGPDLEWTPGGWSSAHSMGCFDGRYAWIPMLHRGAAQKLFMVNVENESVIEWTRDDGLPLAPEDSKLPGATPALGITSLGPGRVCVVGSSGPGWLATAAYDPEKGKSAKVLLEARDQPNPGNDREIQKTNLAFRPSYLYTLTGRLEGEEPSQRVIVGRNTSHQRANEYPLLVDPDTGKVEVIQSPLKSFQMPHATARGDAIVWATTDYVYDRTTSKQKRETHIYRLGYPDFKPELVVNHGEMGGQQIMKVGFDGEAMHCVANPWFVADAVDRPLRRLRGKLPSRVVNLADQWMLAESSIYDWIIYTPRQGLAYGVTLKPDAAKKNGTAIEENGAKAPAEKTPPGKED